MKVLGFNHLSIGAKDLDGLKASLYLDRPHIKPNVPRKAAAH